MMRFNLFRKSARASILIEVAGMVFLIATLVIGISLVGINVLRTTWASQAIREVADVATAQFIETGTISSTDLDVLKKIMEESSNISDPARYHVIITDAYMNPTTLLLELSTSEIGTLSGVSSASVTGTVVNFEGQALSVLPGRHMLLFEIFMLNDILLGTGTPYQSKISQVTTPY